MGECEAQVPRVDGVGGERVRVGDAARRSGLRDVFEPGPGPPPLLSATGDELTIIGEQQSYKICREEGCHDGAMVDFVSLPRTEDLTLA